MSAQDKLEKVLRDMHVLLSKSDPVAGQPGKILVDKQQVLDLLAQLNTSIYGIMEEYEMTARSRDKAEREFRKKGDEIIWDASRKAEDVYAASVMYSEEALNSIQEIMKQANESVQSIYSEMSAKLKEEQQAVAKNQSELKAQLRDLRDTEKYIRLIEDRNEEILKEKRKEGKAPKPEANIYANRKTEIKVNTEMLEQLGYGEGPLESDAPLPLEPLEKEQKKDAEVLKAEDDFELLDDQEFGGKETFSNIEEAMASKKKDKDSEGRKMFRGFSGRK